MSVSVLEIPREIRDLLADLRREDERTNGRPTLPSQQVTRAREWLALLLLDGQALCRHAELLQTFYPGRFEPPASRRFRREGEPQPRETAAASAFRHHQLLPEDRALAVAERGPEALTEDELATLLLNPYALWDLADLIDLILPDYWQERMAKVGQELMQRLGVEIPIPGENELDVTSDRSSL
jgi:hypothetical protein